MNKLKKIIGISMCILLFIGIMPINVQAKEAYTTEQINEAKEYLISIGINKNLVKNLPETEIEKYVDGKLVKQKDVYV